MSPAPSPARARRNALNKFQSTHRAACNPPPPPRLPARRDALKNSPQQKELYNSGTGTRVWAAKGPDGRVYAVKSLSNDFCQTYQVEVGGQGSRAGRRSENRLLRALARARLRAHAAPPPSAADTHVPLLACAA